jgi:hypothetical protein
MLSIERVKELLKGQNISDEEAKEIRDGFRDLVEIIFEKWMVDTDRSERPDSTPLNKTKDFLYDGDADPPKN